MSARLYLAVYAVFALLVLFTAAQNATTTAPGNQTTAAVTSAPGNMTTPSPSGTTATVSSLVTVAVVTAVAAMLS